MDGAMAALACRARYPSPSLEECSAKEGERPSAVNLVEGSHAARRRNRSSAQLTHRQFSQWLRPRGQGALRGGLSSGFPRSLCPSLICYFFTNTFAPVPVMLGPPRQLLGP